MIWTRPKRFKPFNALLIFAGKHRVGAALAGVAIKTQSAAQIVLSIVDFFMILIDCKKERDGEPVPPPLNPPLAPPEKRRAHL